VCFDREDAPGLPARVLATWPKVGRRGQTIFSACLAGRRVCPLLKAKISNPNDKGIVNDPSRKVCSEILSLGFL